MKITAQEHPQKDSIFTRKQEEEEKTMKKNGGGRGKVEEEEEKEEEEKEGKTVVVGIKMDSFSGELLTWALVKVAAAGDRVVALHVLPSAADSSDLDFKSPSSLLSLVKAFDSILAVYDGFCNLKQIELKMKICRGSSVRKVLVHEAKSYGASKMILGVSKNAHSIGSSSAAVAKYCSKHLSQECSVIAVNNGKIIFEREGSDLPDTLRLTALKKADAQTQMAEKVHKARAANKLAIIRNQSANASSSSFLRMLTVSKSASMHNSTSSDAAKNPKHSYSCYSLPKNKDAICIQSKRHESLFLVPVKETFAPATPKLSLPHDSLGSRAGWPFLRKEIVHDRKMATADKSQISGVQWAMRLPSRYSVKTPVHISHKAKPDEESSKIVSAQIFEHCPSPAHIDEEKEIPEELSCLKKYLSVCRLFSYRELVHITSNFSHDNLIGKGGTSHVYKGCLSDGKKLALKILKSSEDAINEFVSEIEIITALHHKNILSLYGFCIEKNCLIMVYDFVSRGSLEDNFHGERERKKMLSWAERYKVALGTAEALHYLHGANNGRPVIHRDVKSSNILLYEDCEPKLSDFGLAKWASASQSPLTCTDVSGTFGYLAPEYFMYGKVSEKTDVYAFGVVLLELLSGRKPVSTGCPKGEESLVMWAMPVLNGGKVEQLVDPCLGTAYNDDQLQRIILAASLCIKRDPRYRPRMGHVVKLLQGNEEFLNRATVQAVNSEEADEFDSLAAFRQSNIQSHINLALFDMEDDSLSVCSREPSIDFLTANKSLEDYLQARWSRSSSFD